MSGRGGRTQRKTSIKLNHQKAWNSMRIMVNFSIPNIIATVPGLSFDSAQRFLKSLTVHSFVAKIGARASGRNGEYQTYQLCNNIGPKYPVTCDKCGEQLTAKVCDPSLKEKETKRETEKEKKVTTARASAQFAEPALPGEELDEIVAQLDAEEEKERQEKREQKESRLAGSVQAADYPNEGWHVLPDQLRRHLDNGGDYDAA